ncbi:chorion peroxidase-like [Tachypleus tridentatus]|uniref:chorion peroxidase-like n=1 Tax=Tachypleus tridentatus TaxID=6853 RepID=UPI003FCF0DDE
MNDTRCLPIKIPQNDEFFSQFNERCLNFRRSASCPKCKLGDRRLNEHPSLTALHAIFMREHNRIARELRRINPCWNDERLFQEAVYQCKQPDFYYYLYFFRRIVIAEVQMITYNEFLSLVVGPYHYNRFTLKPLPDGFFTVYNHNINPAMINEFITACFRFGHSTSHGSFTEIQSYGSLTTFKLKKNFFHPFGLCHGQTELVREPADQLAQKSDNFIVEHRSLNKFTVFISNISNSSFRSVEDIDFFSGSISERPVSDGIVGPTCGFIIALQYNRLRFGDRYFFDVYGEAGSFTPAQLREIREVTLSRILCENSNEVDEQWIFQPVSEKVQQQVMKEAERNEFVLECTSAVVSCTR